ncbi:hypothetical protein HDU88_009021 [Geranomyces variabilis]|nr:hypothetical protein HDU88_009021 [Geranomyces variabilis]
MRNLFLVVLLISHAINASADTPFQQDPVTARTFKDVPDLRISVVGHGNAGTNPAAFWPTLWRGIGAAASLLGVTIWAPLYQSASPSGTGYNIQLWADTVANHSDALVTTFNDVVSQKSPLLQDLAAAPNMPLMVYNSGLNYSSVLKPVTYVGWADWQAGFLVGQELANRGVQRIVCVFRVLGRADFQDRCAGAVTAMNLKYGRNDIWTNETTNPLNYVMGTTDNIPLENLVAGFQTYLAANVQIDGVLATQQQVVDACYGASQNIATNDPSRSPVAIGVVDYSSSVIGKVAVAAHQQTWLQGFVPSIYMYLKLLVNETVTNPIVATGPLLITSSTTAAGNAAVALEAQSSVSSAPGSIAYLSHFLGLAISDQLYRGVSQAAAKWGFSLPSAWVQKSTAYTLPIFQGLVDTILFGCPASCPVGIVTTDPGDDYLNYLSTRAAAYNVRVTVIGTRSASYSPSRAGTLYVGSSDYDIGVSAANAMLAKGVRKPMCFTIDQLTTATTISRCQGLVDTFTAAGVAGVSLSTSAAWVDAYNTPTAKLIIKPFLASSPPDGFLCTNEVICEALVLSLSDAKLTPKAVISVGMSPANAVAMGQGLLTHYVDVAPYASGFLAVTNLGMAVSLKAQLLGNSLTVGGEMRDWVCPPGYQINSASSATLYKTLASGATGYGSICLPCAPGTYTESANQLQCATCPFGTFSTQIATKQCATCSHTNGADQDVCQVYFLSLEVLPSEGIKGALFALAAVGILVQGGIGAGLLFLRRFAVIRGAAPVMSIFITLGGLVAALSVIVLQSGLSKAVCVTHYWLLATGFSLIVTPVIVKNYRMYTIFFNPKLRGNILGISTMLSWLAVVTGGEWFLLALWTGLDAPTKQKFSDSTGTYSLCSSKSSSMQTGFSAALLLYNAILLISALLVANLTKAIKDKSFSESLYVAFSMAGIAICAIIAVAAGFMPNIDLPVRWVIVNLAIILGSVIVPAILFGSRISLAFREKVTEDQATTGDGEVVKKPLFSSKGKGASAHIGVDAAILEGSVVTRWVGVTASLLLPSPFPSCVVLHISRDAEHQEKGDFYIISAIKENCYQIDTKTESEYLVLVSGKASKTRLILQFSDQAQIIAWKDLIMRAIGKSGTGATSHSSAEGSNTNAVAAIKKSALETEEEEV